MAPQPFRTDLKLALLLQAIKNGLNLGQQYRLP